MDLNEGYLCMTGILLNPEFRNQFHTVIYLNFVFISIHIDFDVNKSNPKINVDVIHMLTLRVLQSVDTFMFALHKVISVITSYISNLYNSSLSFRYINKIDEKPEHI